jgi:protein-S-isoprenylcysteine O-methyltransferase Ste14
LIAAFLANPTEEIIFYVTYVALLLSEFIGAAILPRLRQRGGVKTTSDRGSRGIIFFGLVLAIFIGFEFANRGIALLPNYFFYIGIALMILGIIIRQWAIATLGRFFALTVRITEDHKVVSNGPYRLVRHPSYTGLLLSFCGLALALESWGALLVILLVYAIVIGYRMSVEEKLLEAQLGDDYRAYMKRTKRLIPYIY